MRSAWSKIFRGLSQVAEGVAEAVEGGAPAPSMEATPITDAAPAAGINKDVLTTLLGGLASQISGRPPQAAAPEAPDHPAPPAPMPVPVPAGVEEPDDSAIPAIENGVPILECPELHRQRNEQRRRRVLRQDPVNAIAVIAYWARHLVSTPTRAEEWVRCIEAIPGSAGDRLSRALHLGLPELQRYAGYFDEIHRDVEEAKQVAAALRENKPDVANDLLDADRLGRLWFQIGDRPDVEALTELPEPDGVVEPIGSDHIEGPPGSIGLPDEPIESVMSPEEEAEVAGIAEAFDQEQDVVRVTPMVPPVIPNNIDTDTEELPSSEEVAAAADAGGDPE